MSAVISGLLYGWDKNLDYGQRLIADLGDEQMILQPVQHGAPANHPAWIFSHLNVYLPVIAAIIEDQPFEDPKPHKYGMLSKPESDPDCYPNKQELLSEFAGGHERVKQLLLACDNRVFDNQVHLPRWSEIMPTAGHALPYLMLNHESMHFGQLSAWRRLQGMPSV